MRSRNIKPSFFKNEIIGSLPYECRILFIGLWLMADKEGFLEHRPMRIKAELFPYDNITSDKIEKLLENLCNLDPSDKLIEIWFENGKPRFIQVINFISHQSPHKNEKSYEISDLIFSQENSCNFMTFQESSLPIEERGKRKEERGKRNNEKGPAKPGKKKFQAEKPDTVSESVWSDFLVHRKAKKAPLTETALAGIQKQAEKAGWSLEDALSECNVRGWVGFKADWVDKPGFNGGNGNGPMTRSERNADACARACEIVMSREDEE